MASVIGPDFLALQVRDLEASKRFYTECLGLMPVPNSPPNAIVFQTSPIPFAMRTPMVDLDESPKLGWGVALWLQADDADALYTSLQERGVPISQTIFDGPFGRTFSCIDPNGYNITIHGPQS